MAQGHHMQFLNTRLWPSNCQQNQKQLNLPARRLQQSIVLHLLLET